MIHILVLIDLYHSLHRLHCNSLYSYILTYITTTRACRQRNSLVSTWNQCHRPGIPKLQDLLLDDLRWSWGNNNRNKMHNKCYALESSWNHTPLPGSWKNCLPRNQSVKCQKIWGRLPYKMGFGNSSNQRNKKSSTLNCGFRGRVNWLGRDFTRVSAYRKTWPFQGIKRESKMIMIRVWNWTEPTDTCVTMWAPHLHPLTPSQ